MITRTAFKDKAALVEAATTKDELDPAFLIVNDELVLVTVWTFGGAGSGTPVAKYISDINQMIVDADTQASVSTGYTVTEADFSEFPNYA